MGYGVCVESPKFLTSTLHLSHTAGNLVHLNVPISQDEDNNRVERTWGSPRDPAGKIWHTCFAPHTMDLIPYVIHHKHFMRRP
ncbi:hypothetical protein EON63_07750 [archaeon]|nr:MAG: hypothetical protein EON63_07750 [archaeon]